MLSQTLSRVPLLDIVQGRNISEGIIQRRPKVGRSHGHSASIAAETGVHVVEVLGVVAPPAAAGEDDVVAHEAAGRHVGWSVLPLR